ncbi:DsbA family protein [Litoreibacter roseus]|uniref:Thiol-disulfide oxidoreductase n=1 Tax=Litoreibacter roseus TaxID=2601869 RepID=A0A6N6JJX6_9RHOB|nr:DsbA family protein [Litoreibacter roseus]GFE66247.1 thiol-disulfide oxidoreductase [Litoreibacter roseus]
MNKTLVIGAAVAVAIGVGAMFFSGSGAQQSPVSPAQAQTAGDVDISGVQDMTIGAEDAPITIVEYASFTCPHCRTFHENAFKQLKADYIDTGKAKFVFREVYFDRYGLWAGMVARCDGGSRYFGIVDMIFETQQQWTQGENVDIANNLKKMGLLAGMDGETIDACLQDAEKAKALTAFYQQNAQADGIRATPSFVINGTTHSNMSYADMKEILDAEL